MAFFAKDFLGGFSKGRFPNCPKPKVTVNIKAKKKYMKDLVDTIT